MRFKEFFEIRDFVRYRSVMNFLTFLDFYFGLYKNTCLIFYHKLTNFNSSVIFISYRPIRYILLYAQTTKSIVRYNIIFGIRILTTEVQSRQNRKVNETSKFRKLSFHYH